MRCGFGLALALLLFGAAASYVSAVRSVETFRGTSRAERVLDRLEEVLMAMLDVETGGRGYAASGSEPFLEPYVAGRARAVQSFNQLRTLTADDPQQQQRLAELEPLITSRIADIAELIEVRKARGLEAAARKIASGEGKQVMDRVRRVVSQMEQAETELLTERSTKAEAGARATIFILISGALLALAVVAIASVLLHRDIVERKRVEKERDHIWNLSRDLLCVAGFEGYFKSLNPAWEKTFGFSRAELQAKPYMEFVHPGDRTGTSAEAEKVATGAEVIHFENRYLCKDGSYRWLAWSARPVVAEQTVYATARDVTEEKRVQDRVKQLNADLQQRAGQLEAANKELEAFSYSVSHDLRAPLRHVDGYVGRLAKAAGDKLDEKSRRYLGIISDAAKEMGRLIDDLLVFSRMGRTEMEQEMVELKELAEGAILGLRQEAQSRNIHWKKGQLPAVFGDAAMLRQVWVNLLSNAVKYTRPRDPAEIEIGCAGETDGEVVVFVRDNGVGFEMEYADKLFGVFQRLHPADQFEGTGIGLANVRRIVQRHGGRTWAEGKVDQGATFYFSLPKTHKG
jgi:PAS domain S-box-containing protein